MSLAASSRRGDSTAKVADALGQAAPSMGRGGMEASEKGAIGTAAQRYRGQSREHGRPAEKWRV